MVRHSSQPARHVSNVAAPLVLIVAVLTAAWPAVRGELLPYMDNPAHLAEIRELAQAENNGWSDLAYVGFPLHSLQPPLIFRGLALVERTGALPLEPLYVALTIIGLILPALAFYAFARGRLPAAGALALASTIVLYRGSLVGGASALGGMFSFQIAAAAFIVMIDLLARRERRPRDFALLALGAGFIGLTHMYITIALVYLCAIHVAYRVFRDRSLTPILRDVAALSLGAIIAAPYWLVNVLARTSAPSFSESLPRAAFRVMTTSIPAPPPGTGLIDRLAYDPVYHVDAIPQILVLGLAAVGLRRALTSEDNGLRYGAMLGIVMALLLCVEAATGARVLGPQSVRLVWVLKISLLICAIPVVATLLQQRLRPYAILSATAIVVVFFAWTSRSIVAHESPKSTSELADVERVWAWLQANKRNEWGRVYLQDTFGGAPELKLSQSHILAETSSHTGVQQLGPFYGSNPYIKSWVYSDAEFVFGMTASDPSLVDRSVERMRQANATHLVLSTEKFASYFLQDPRFAAHTVIGRFTILELRGSSSAWGFSPDGGEPVDVSRLRTGRFKIVTPASGQRVVISEAFHRFWRIETSGTTEMAGDIRPTAEALLNVTLPKGASSVEIAYSPPTWPALGPIAGIGGTALMMGIDVAKRRRAALAHHPKNPVASSSHL